MTKRLSLVISVFLAAGFGGAVLAQQSKYPMMEKIAQVEVQNYQTASCKDLQQKKSKKPTGQESNIPLALDCILRFATGASMHLYWDCG